MIHRGLTFQDYFDVCPQTEEPYATAWNGYKYIGRIRPSDGFVVLLQEPVSYIVPRIICSTQTSTLSRMSSLAVGCSGATVSNSTLLF